MLFMFWIDYPSRESRRVAARANQRPVFSWLLTNERGALDNPSVSQKGRGTPDGGRGRNNQNKDQ